MSHPDHHVAPNPDDIDIMHVFGALKRNAMRLVLLAVLAGAVTYGTLSMVAPTYESEAELTVVARDGRNPFKDPKTDGLNSEALATRMDKEAVNTHVRGLESRELVAQIANELKLSDKVEFNSTLGSVDQFSALLRMVGIGGPRAGETEEDRVLKAVFSKLSVYSNPDSRVITIRFTSIDPALAAKFANTLADAYRSKLAAAAVTETNAVQDALGPKISNLSDEVSKAEAEVTKYRASAGLLRGGSQKTPLNDQQLGDLTTELTRAKAARAAAEARAASARRLMRQGTPEVIPEVQRSVLVQNLIQQKVQVERDLRKASATMKGAHPVIRQLQADLASARRQIGAEVANVVASLEKEVFVAAEQEASIVESLDVVKARVADTGADEVKLRQLEAVAKSKRAELERLQSQFEANRGRADAGSVPVETQILTAARPSSVPVAPRKGAFTLLVAAGTLLFGIAAVIIGALSSGARSRQAAVAANAGEAPQAVIVNTEQPSVDPLRAGILVEAAKAARQQQDQARPGDGPGATSPGSGEPVTAFSNPRELAQAVLEAAKTTQNGFRTMIATADAPSSMAPLVRELAEALKDGGGQALVIDWALDGKGMSGALGIKRSPGFSELLRSTATFSETVHRVPGSKVHMIPSGSAFAESGEGLDADQINLILDALDEAYDHIVLVASEPAARVLFETIQGRVDAGVSISSTRGVQFETSPRPGTFLGFDVTDIELMTLVPFSNGQADSPSLSVV